ncbi:MAG: ABC transporter substrate-binding protein [Deltaproteobacteria bacterium]|nr:ABC transporter substrate-binding protein [Deltaproteobacteria bacterium]
MSASLKKTVTLFGILFVWAGLFGGVNPAGGDPVRRVISIGPNITETVFAIGRGDFLVGVTDFCVYPPQALALPKVGGVFNPNLERIAVLNPDLVILQGRHEKLDTFCRARGIETLHMAMDSLSSIYQGIVAMGRALGASKQARTLNTAIHGKLEAVRRAVAPFPRQKVFISLGRAMGTMSQVYTVGGSSFLSEILSVAGGDNIFADVNRPYPEASKESLLKRSPDAIFLVLPEDPGIGYVF